MAKFRKTAVITAEQFLPESEWPEGIYQRGEKAWFISTLEGEMSVTPGAWVITGVKGERYACDNEIFQQTYERVDE